jgi:two-component system, LytTR family, response regulator
MIRCVLIEDEPPARRKMLRMLAEDAEFTVVGAAANGADGVALIHEQRPDLAFLDVQLPDCTGFDVLAALEDRGNLQVIFVTAFDEYALKAFEVHALDYLMKPVEPSKFAVCLDRVKRFMNQDSPTVLAARLDQLLTTMQAHTDHVRRLLVQDGQRSLFIDVQRIDWIESARNYTCLHVDGRTQIVRSTLEGLAAKLDPRRFRRLNRSEVVNVERIAEVRSALHGDQKVILKDGTELMWSRRYRTESLEDLEKF